MLSFVKVGPVLWNAHIHHAHNADQRRRNVMSLCLCTVMCYFSFNRRHIIQMYHITIVLICHCTVWSVVHKKIPNHCNEVGKTVYQSRKKWILQHCSKIICISEKYCYWYVTKRKQKEKNLMCGDRSQDPLYAKLRRNHLPYFASWKFRCIIIIVSILVCVYADKCQNPQI